VAWASVLSSGGLRNRSTLGRRRSVGTVGLGLRITVGTTAAEASAQNQNRVFTLSEGCPREAPQERLIARWGGGRLTPGRRGHYGRETPERLPATCPHACKPARDAGLRCDPFTPGVGQRARTGIWQKPAWCRGCASDSG